MGLGLVSVGGARFRLQIGLALGCVNPSLYTHCLINICEHDKCVHVLEFVPARLGKCPLFNDLPLCAPGKKFTVTVVVIGKQRTLKISGSHPKPRPFPKVGGPQGCGDPRRMSVGATEFES